jgi:hypothetical protein
MGQVMLQSMIIEKVNEYEQFIYFRYLKHHELNYKIYDYNDNNFNFNILCQYYSNINNYYDYQEIKTHFLSTFDSMAISSQQSREMERLGILNPYLKYYSEMN